MIKTILVNLQESNIYLDLTDEAIRLSKKDLITTKQKNVQQTTF